MKKIIFSKWMPVFIVLVPLAGMAQPLPELDCLVEPNQVVDVGSPEHGVVEMIAVERSDTVSAHDVLAKLESSEQASAVRKARARVNMGAEIKARQATLAFAQRKQERMRDLFASDAISSHQRDEVETELKMAQMQLQQARDAVTLARIELDRASSDLNRRTIRSPISGVVVERFVAPGEFVNEKPLMRVAQMDPLRIETIAPAALFGKIRPGMQAEIIAENYAGQMLAAEIKIVDRLIDPASGTFGIRLELPNPDHAIPSGLNCRLRILPQRQTAAVAPPEPVDKVPDVTAATAGAKPAADTAPAAEFEPAAATAPAEQIVPAKVPTPDAATAAMESAEPLNEPKPSVAVRKVEPVAPVIESIPTVATTAMESAKPVSEPEPIVETAELVHATPVSEAEPGKTVTPPTPSLACTTFGPFDDDNQLDALLGTLGTEAREIGRRADSEVQTTGFFVATRKLASMDEARALSETMKKFGIQDLAVLSAGPNQGRVSLGLFRQQDYAKTRQQKLARLGIETEIVPRRLETRQVWLDVELSESTLEQAPWKALAPEVGNAACEPSLYVMANAAESTLKAE